MTKVTNLKGLSTEEVNKLQMKYGKNNLGSKKKRNFFSKICGTICEPMFLLLLIAAITYLILGETSDGAVMFIFVLVMISIEVIQEWKTDRTLNALKNLSAPHITVIRDGREVEILSEDLVPGDLMIIYEGVKIPADGFVISCNDICVDESSLTGESEGVWKIISGETDTDLNYWRKDYCYTGTLVTQGTAKVLVDKIGKETEYGRIGEGIALAPEEKTNLQKQTKNLVKFCAALAAVLFVLVGIITYFNASNFNLENKIIEAVLSGITLAMAMIPEEFPVVLTVFLSMGAWRLARKNSLVRKLPSVETLGSISVLCVDKTGTITNNQMEVECIWTYQTDEENFIKTMGCGCEIDAYDPMEKAMLSYCNTKGLTENQLFCGSLVKEYPFTNQLKMMGHVWSRDDKIEIAAKGSPEKIISICNMSKDESCEVLYQVEKMASVGMRVIAVASALLLSAEEIPENIENCELTLLGLVGLSDPPRKNIKKDIKICNKAGIRVVMITGDNGVTAASIAKEIGMGDYHHSITGGDLDEMSDEELRDKVKSVSIFSRVIPEHKMRIVKALKENGEIVAMTGDGVNDAPALKYADIGIAMGKRGSEVSREAADLILMDDNFTTIVETIRDGRRIYDNIRKAVGYIFTIHIPIALCSLLAPMLGIGTAGLLLLPIHIVLLELVIDPTCSIVLERQPAEKNIMERSPRSPKEGLINIRLLMKSSLQGLAIFAAAFTSYYFLLDGNPANAPEARSAGIGIIILANLFLVQVNSSDQNPAFQSMKFLVKDKVMWAANLFTVLGLFIMFYSPLNHFLKFVPLTFWEMISMLIIAAGSVFWYEIVKLVAKH